MALRFLLIALGSSGDVHPFIALGRALRSRGHRVTLATNDLFEKLIIANRLHFASLGSHEEAEALMRDPRLWHERRSFAALAEGVIVPQIDRVYRLIEKHQGPDLVVAASTLALGAHVAREKLGVPMASVHLQPAVYRSLHEASRIGPLSFSRRVPRPAKRLVYWAVDRFAVDPKVCPALNRYRAALGLGPTRRVFGEPLHAPGLDLGLFPDWFAPPQPDWPSSTRLTGFLMFDAAPQVPLSKEAEAFLADGPPPLVVTPGSAAADRHLFFRGAIEACTRAGMRAMLVTNHPGQLPANLPDSVRAFGYLPFSTLLVRSAGLISHGGIGTLAQAVRAGVPHLVVPNAHDQPDNGERIEKLGLGKSVRASQLLGPSGKAAIESVFASPDVRARCQEFSRRIHPEHSALLACELLEGLATSPGCSSRGAG